VRDPPGTLDLRSYIRDIPDYPKPGIVFRDLTPLFLDPEALEHAIALLAAWASDRDVDYVVAAEARGFVLGGAIAARIGAGNLHITVPRFVDVVVHAKVNVGNSDVFNSTWDGVNNPSRTITDNDTDGPGHGHLTLDLRVNAGTLEVSR